MKKRISLFSMIAALVSFTVLFSGFPEGATGELEIFSWWAGDEGPALDALIKVYVQQNPGVKVNNATVTGGAGVNAKAVLKTRMLGGKPPDSFQVHAGQELIGTWVVADRMEDLTFLFKEQGWMNVFPKDLVKLIGTDKGIWSVPVNIHRSNVMWYIPANLKKWGVSVPKTWDEFFATADKLKAKGITPLALGENWTVIHLWESVALGVLGADKWDQLWAGKLAFNSKDAENVWKVFGKILDYANTDYASLSWQQASDLVINGKAAFNVMGDWAAGYFMTTKKLKPNVDFGWTTPSGNQGFFMFLADSFGLPKGVKNRKAVIEWLKVCGSKAGQDAFNPLKGSVAARKDSDLSKYSEYSKSAGKDLQSNRVVGSLIHGVVANEGFMNDFQKVMEGFLTNKDAAKAARSAADLAKKNKIGM